VTTTATTVAGVLTNEVSKGEPEMQEAKLIRTMRATI